MNIKLKDAIAALYCCQKINKESFPLKTAYKLTKLTQELEEEIKVRDEAVKASMLKYAVKDENGEPVINHTERGDTVEIPPEIQKDYYKEVEDLDNSEVEIKDYKFLLKDFGDISLSIDDLKGLLIFIDEEE